MEFSAKQIADLLGGVVEGNASDVVTTVSKIEEGKAGTLSFLANPAYTPYIYSTQASVVIVNRDFKPDKPISATLIRVDDAYQAFAKLLEQFDDQKSHKTGIEMPSHISESAKTGTNLYLGSFSYIGDNTIIGDNVKIFPNVYIGDNVEINDNALIHSGVKISSGSNIGANCTFHMGAVVGADGFGFAPNNNRQYEKVAQTGNVIIEDNVEVGANTTIDRATLGSTIIRKGVKLDNLIQIAHNVEIGEHTVIAAQTGIAGSTKIGSGCMIGGQVGIAGHLTIANNVKIAGQSGIASSIEQEGEVVQGTPAFNSGEFKRSIVLFKKFPWLLEKIYKLESELEKFKKRKTLIS